MAQYKAGIIGLGFIGAADQVSGDALGQQVEDLDGTHWAALHTHPEVEVVSGSSRDAFCRVPAGHGKAADAPSGQ